MDAGAAHLVLVTTHCRVQRLREEAQELLVVGVQDPEARVVEAIDQDRDAAGHGGARFDVGVRAGAAEAIEPLMGWTTRPAPGRTCA